MIEARWPAALAGVLVGGLAMSHASAAGVEPEVTLNRQWAEQ